MNLSSRVAQVSIGNVGTTFGLGTTDLKQSAINATQWVLGLLGLLALIFFIIGGIDWMISGDSEVVKIRARRIMIYSLVALVIILLSWAIVAFVVGSTTNLTN